MLPLPWRELTFCQTLRLWQLRLYRYQRLLRCHPCLQSLRPHPASFWLLSNQLRLRTLLGCFCEWTILYQRTLVRFQRLFTFSFLRTHWMGIGVCDTHFRKFSLPFRIFRSLPFRTLLGTPLRTCRFFTLLRRTRCMVFTPCCTHFQRLF